MTIEEIFMECPTTARRIKPIDEVDIPKIVIRIVADYFDFPISKITGKSKKDVAKARSYAIYFIWKYTNLYQRQIAQYFKGGAKGGCKNRTIVVHARKIVLKEMSSCKDLKDEFMSLCALIESAIYS